MCASICQDSSIAKPSADPGWRFWIDRGGTFTDLVARHPDGRLIVHKLLSQNDSCYQDAALAGIREVLELDADAPLAGQPISQIRMGTTVATNALLERKGEPVLLVVNCGFHDALKIAYQNRPDLFARKIELTDQLYHDVLEASCRIDHEGHLIHPLDPAEIEAGLQQHFAKGLRSLAIVFMHGYRFPDHEQAVAAIARTIGFTHISTSHDTIPLVKLIGRGDTTVADAYLSPILRRYVDRIAGELGGIQMQFMQSSGGLIDAQRFLGKDSILSGPAGGIIGASEVAEQIGYDRLITFDMGGTSTDVALYDRGLERSFDQMISQIRVRAPMLNIHTVAAGGGSICHFTQGRYQTGPDSAGADPGPACYRRGGPLTITDCNLVLGKLDPAWFPHIFGERRDAPLDREVVEQQFARLASQIEAETGKRTSAVQAAQGFLDVAVENMAQAIKKISVARGFDVTEFCLVAFGGAGGQHACLVADRLGIETIMIHPLASVLSAYGMGRAAVRILRQQSLERKLELAAMDIIDQMFDELTIKANQELAAQQISADDPEVRIETLHRIHLRYAGSDNALELDRAGLDELHQQFQTLHLQRFGYVMDKPDLVAATVAVELSAFHEFDKDIQFKIPRSTRDDLPDQGFASIYMDGEYQPSMVLHRDQMEAGQIIQGPAILCESGSATIVEPGWQVQKLTGGELLLTRHQPKVRNQTIGTDCDPVMLEVFNNLFMSIAEQMGFTLQNTAHSVNIKERLDFSCALFDAKGNLVANAPHMPVHLGSMGESVRAVLSQGREHLRPGDVYALNVPWRGGTHLPDLTVLTPVFDPSGKEILFFTASRGHHSDVGGITPGSMPSFSTHIEEEGVLLDNFLLVSQGQFCEQPLREALAAGPYPARNPDQNIADLQAQIAANAKGVQELNRMISHYGLAVVQAYMQHVQDNAEAAVRAVISRLDDGEYCYAMDHGAHVRVKVAIDRKRQEAIVDFTGTSPQQANNFNAPSSVCRAAVLYVFRCLVDEAIPMNEGCLKPIKLIIEPASMLAPEYPAAVVAGNVETSQTITDCLFAALKVMGAAQGTMNNLTFGNQRVQYYETICGGAGAGPGFHGADAVHTHMTNSRLTDPEILEMRFPVILQTFEIMHGSGGRGRWCGGAGVRRQLRFLETVECSLLANRHIIAPYGMAGGHDGRPGRARIIRANGTVEVLASCASTVLHAGDVLDLETPSGGGFGTMPASAGAAGKS